MKRLLISLYIITTSILATTFTYAAEGDIVWQQVYDLGFGVEGFGIAVDDTGVYGAGSAGPIVGNNSRWYVERRDQTNGNLVWSKIVDLTSGFDVAYGVSVDASGVYIAGGTGIGSVPDMWRIEKRSKVDGSLIWSSSVNAPASPVDAEHVSVITGDQLQIYVAGSDGTNIRIQKLRKSDGVVLWTQIDLLPGCSDWYYPTGIAIDGGALFYSISGTCYDINGNANSIAQIEKRGLDGSLIWNKNVGTVSADALTVDSTSVYVLGAWYVPLTVQKIDKVTGAISWTYTDPSVYANGYCNPVQTIAQNNKGVYFSVENYLSSDANHLPDTQILTGKLDKVTGAKVWTKATNLSGLGDCPQASFIFNDGLYVIGQVGADPYYHLLSTIIQRYSIIPDVVVKVWFSYVGDALKKVFRMG